MCPADGTAVYPTETDRQYNRDMWELLLEIMHNVGFQPQVQAIYRPATNKSLPSAKTNTDQRNALNSISLGLSANNYSVV